MFFHTKILFSSGMGQAPVFQSGNLEYGGVSAYGEATQLTFHREDADGVDQSTFLNQYLKFCILTYVFAMEKCDNRLICLALQNVEETEKIILESI